MKAADFWREIKTIANETATRYTPFRAKATNINNNGIQIQTYDSEAPLGERYAKLRGPSVNPGDEVAVIPYGGSNLVLGSVGEGTNKFTNPVLIQPSTNTNGTLIIRDANGADVLIVDTPTGAASIKGSMSIDGVMANRVTLAPEVAISHHATYATVQNTTTVQTYQQAMSRTVTLPVGTYNLQGVYGLGVRHSAGQIMAMRLLINGTQVANMWAATGLPNQWGMQVGGVVTTINGGVNELILEYQSNAAGTAYAFNPWLNLVARRTT